MKQLIAKSRKEAIEFAFDQRTTTDIENIAACRLLSVIACTLGIATAAGLIIAATIYL